MYVFVCVCATKSTEPNYNTEQFCGKNISKFYLNTSGFVILIIKYFIIVSGYVRICMIYIYKCSIDIYLWQMKTAVWFDNNNNVGMGTRKEHFIIYISSPFYVVIIQQNVRICINMVMDISHIYFYYIIQYIIHIFIFGSFSFFDTLFKEYTRNVLFCFWTHVENFYNSFSWICFFFSQFFVLLLWNCNNHVDLEFDIYFWWYYIVKCSFRIFFFLD